MFDNPNFHRRAQLFLWIPGINILTIIGSFTAYPAAVLAHSIGCSLITILSVFDSYSLLINNLPLDDSDHYLYFHVILGGLCITSAVCQSLLGIFTRLSNIFGVKSINILMMKRLHMISGLILTLMMKMQIYHFVETRKVPLWLTIDIVTIIIYLYVKSTQKKLTYCEPQPTTLALQTVSNINAIVKEDSEFCVFKNLVYDLSPLRIWHPAGFQIL